MIISDPEGVAAKQAEAFQKGFGMGSTYLSLHYHLVFGTKKREPVIAEEWRSHLHEYLGGVIRRLEGLPQGIGGTADHVHILLGLKATHCLCDVIREMKKASTVWVHDTMKAPYFAWQEGYSAFTVSGTAREPVRNYVANQEKHHRQKSYQEELLEMLRKVGIEFDPKYFE